MALKVAFCAIEMPEKDRNADNRDISGRVGGPGQCRGQLQ